MHEVAELDCHELLLRLAGRLPDAQLWRFRDWLASGAQVVLARSLPASLLQHRIALSEREHRLLSDSLIPFGADRAALAALTVIDEVGRSGAKFSLDHPEVPSGSDAVAVVLAASLRSRAGVREVRCTWRRGQRPGEPSKRVILVTASADLAGLTGEVQRVLRALGEHEPCVEVLPSGMELPDYHHAAWEAAELVCVGVEGGVAWTA